MMDGRASDNYNVWGKHINNAFKEELNDQVVVAKFATTASDGKNLSRRLLYSGYDYLCNDCRVKTGRKEMMISVIMNCLI